MSDLPEDVAEFKRLLFDVKDVQAMAMARLQALGHAPDSMTLLASLIVFTAARVTNLPIERIMEHVGVVAKALESVDQLVVQRHVP